MYVTDSFKVLARETGMTVSQIRSIAADLGLDFKYDSNRRTWYLNENPKVVRMFNNHLWN